jgi:hypothetical protein
MVASLKYTAHFTTPYTHNLLAKMERKWATLADSVTAMLHHANCPTKYWGLAMGTAVYLRNRLPSPAASPWSGGVPYTLFHGVPTDLAHVKVFGCTAYLRLEDRYRDKLMMARATHISTSLPGNSFAQSLLPSLSLSPLMHPSLLALHKPLHPMVLSMGGAPVPTSRVMTPHTSQFRPATLLRS